MSCLRVAGRLAPASTLRPAAHLAAASRAALLTARLAPRPSRLIHSSPALEPPPATTIASEEAAVAELATTAASKSSPRGPLDDVKVGQIVDLRSLVSPGGNGTSTVVYEGPLGNTFKLLKMFSLSSLGLSTAISPFIFILESSLPTSGRVFLAVTAMATTSFSTWLISLFTTPYVNAVNRFVPSDGDRSRTLMTLTTADVLTRPRHVTLLPLENGSSILTASDRPMTNFKIEGAQSVGELAEDGCRAVAVMQDAKGKVTGIWRTSSFEAGRGMAGEGSARKTTYFMLPSDAFAAKSRPAATPSSVRAFSTAAVGRPRSLTPSIDSRRTFFSPAKLALTAAASAITTASLLPRLTTRSPPNYPNHQPINALENAFLAAGSGVVGLLDTRRGDLVALLSETSSQWTIPHLHEAMAADAEGRQILKDRPLLNSSTVDLDKLRELKRGTLGREWVEWLAQSGLTPDTREEVRHVDSPVLAYTMTRYRQTHDLYHTLFSLPPTLPHELTLKVVELANMGQPVALLSSLFGPLRLPRHSDTGRDRATWSHDWLPYALRQGSRARKQLVGIYWEQRWSQGLGELRRELGVQRMEDRWGVEQRWKGYGRIREKERELRRKGEWVDEPEEW